MLHKFLCSHDLCIDNNILLLCTLFFDIRIIHTHIVRQWLLHNNSPVLLGPGELAGGRAAPWCSCAMPAEAVMSCDCVTLYYYNVVRVLVLVAS